MERVNGKRFSCVRDRSVVHSIGKNDLKPSSSNILTSFKHCQLDSKREPKK